MAVLELRDVCHEYGRGPQRSLALDGLSLQVAAGEFVAVMGPSGSGKSTLLAVAGGLLTPTSGEVVVAGQPLAGLDADALAAVRRRSVGYVHQEYNLVPTLTALENIALPLELDGQSAREARPAAQAALAAVGLHGLGDRFLDQLSGGQRQRVAVARGIVGERRLVLADEPTGALDSHSGDEVLELLRDLADDGVAVVLVTHEARHAGWADRVVFLRDGREVDRARATLDAHQALERVTSTVRGANHADPAMGSAR